MDSKMVTVVGPVVGLKGAVGAVSVATIAVAIVVVIVAVTESIAVIAIAIVGINRQRLTFFFLKFRDFTRYLC